MPRTRTGKKLALTDRTDRSGRPANAAAATIALTGPRPRRSSTGVAAADALTGRIVLTDRTVLTDPTGPTLVPVPVVAAELAAG